RCNVRANPGRRPSGHESHFVRNSEFTGWKRIFINERKALAGAHLRHFSEPKPEQDALLYPDVNLPAAACFFGSANFAASKSVAKFQEGFSCIRSKFLGRDQSLNLSLHNHVE